MYLSHLEFWQDWKVYANYVLNISFRNTLKVFACVVKMCTCVHLCGNARTVVTQRQLLLLYVEFDQTENTHTRQWQILKIASTTSTVLYILFSCHKDIVRHGMFIFFSSVRYLGPTHNLFQNQWYSHFGSKVEWVCQNRKIFNISL